MNDQPELKLSDLEGLGLQEFDASEYLEDDEAIAVYLNEALESGDSSLFAAALNDVARARGMTEIARKSGLARESLYKALRPGSQPRMETITRVLMAMNVRLVAQPFARDVEVTPLLKPPMVKQASTTTRKKPLGAEAKKAAIETALEMTAKKVPTRKAPAKKAVVKSPTPRRTAAAKKSEVKQPSAAHRRAA